MPSDKKIVAGGVDEYISSVPVEAQDALRQIRSIIREVAPDAIETTSYFGIAGYSYEGYDYNGMFVWFSHKGSTVRLHVRPPVIDDHKQQVAKYDTTKSVVSFPLDESLPVELIKKLTQASLDEMKK